MGLDKRTTVEKQPLSKPIHSFINIVGVSVMCHTDEEIKTMLVEVLDAQDAVAATMGGFRNRLKPTYDVKIKYQAVRQLLEELPG